MNTTAQGWTHTYTADSPPVLSLLPSHTPQVVLCQWTHTPPPHTMAGWKALVPLRKPVSIPRKAITFKPGSEHAHKTYIGRERTLLGWESLTSRSRTHIQVWGVGNLKHLGDELTLNSWIKYCTVFSLKDMTELNVTSLPDHQPCSVTKAFLRLTYLFTLRQPVLDGEED